MTKVQLKESLYQLIDQIEDEQLLNAYLRILENSLPTSNSTIIAYKADGKPLNQTEYKADIDLAIKEVELGKVVSIQEMEEGL